MQANTQPIDLVEVQRASSETARGINCEIVLDIIRGGQPISRADIARQSGLQRSTVSQIVKQLMGEGWACESPVPNWRRGRRPTVVRLNEERCAIAVDIRPRSALVALVDLNGRPLMISEIAFTGGATASARLIVEEVLKALHENRAHSIDGIGISVPSRVDPATHRMVVAPNVDWSDIELSAEIESRAGLPVKMENAANACVIAAFTFGHLQNIRNMIVVTISETIGIGILANGRLITGEGGRAGEFGHVLLDSSGPLCACGRNGCWEVLASCNAALRHYQKLEPQNQEITFHELICRADNGDINAANAICEQATQIGRGLSVLIAGLAPKLIFIAGEITTSWLRYGPIIEHEAARFVTSGTLPPILPFHDGEFACLRGAGALVFQRYLLPPASKAPAARAREKGRSHR